MYQETVEFYHLWRLAVQERDEARELLKRSLAELSQLQELCNTILLSQDQHIPSYEPKATDETTGHQSRNYNNHFPGDSPSKFSSASPLDFFSNLSVNSSPDLCDSDCHSLRSNQMGFVGENIRDFESVVLEMIGGVLPENGKFLQAVSEAGSSVKSMLITGPVPKWSNHPVQLLSQTPVLKNSTTGNWNDGGLEIGSGIQNRSFLGNS